MIALIDLNVSWDCTKSRGSTLSKKSDSGDPEIGYYYKQKAKPYKTPFNEQRVTLGEALLDIVFAGFLYANILLCFGWLVYVVIFLFF